LLESSFTLALADRTDVDLLEHDLVLAFHAEQISTPACGKTLGTLPCPVWLRKTNCVNMEV